MVPASLLLGFAASILWVAQVGPTNRCTCTRKCPKKRDINVQRAPYISSSNLSPKSLYCLLLPPMLTFRPPKYSTYAEPPPSSIHATFNVHQKNLILQLLFLSWVIPGHLPVLHGKSPRRSTRVLGSRFHGGVQRKILVGAGPESGDTSSHTNPIR